MRGKEGPCKNMQLGVRSRICTCMCTYVRSDVRYAYVTYSDGGCIRHRAVPACTLPFTAPHRPSNHSRAMQALYRRARSIPHPGTCPSPLACSCLSPPGYLFSPHPLDWVHASHLRASLRGVPLLRAAPGQLRLGTVAAPPCNTEGGI